MKALAHYLAAAVVVVYGFMMSPAGQAIAQQYPKLVPFVSAATTIGAVYFSPKTNA